MRNNPPKALIAKSKAEHRLYQLQADWRYTTNPKARQALASAIASHPEWNITCGSDGPMPAQTAPQQRQNMAVLRENGRLE